MTHQSSEAFLGAQRDHPISGPIHTAAQEVRTRMLAELSNKRSLLEKLFFVKAKPNDSDLDEYMRRLTFKLVQQGYQAPMQRPRAKHTLPGARYCKDGESFMFTVFLNLSYYVKEWDPDEAGSH